MVVRFSHRFLFVLQALLGALHGQPQLLLGHRRQLQRGLLARQVRLELLLELRRELRKELVPGQLVERRQTVAARLARQNQAEQRVWEQRDM